ncbi:MAG: hypothetical protein GXP27_09555 [Planctomycetes bacterium]|nr:hypothetical protein [Planctomycetota bacterium]
MATARTWFQTTWLGQPLPVMPEVALDAWRRSGSAEPSVARNGSPVAVTVHEIVWTPGRLSLHPGPTGEYSVVRFTVPRDGRYRVEATFVGIDPRTTTDVYVVHAGRPLFDSAIRLAGQGRKANYQGEITARRGETIDCVVGWGNGSYVCDSTGLDFVVTANDGQRFDASAQFSSEQNPGDVWSYGWLSPGQRPDIGTFRPYDRPCRERSVRAVDRPVFWKHDLPFSFVYGGRSSTELLSNWKRTESTANLDGNRTQYELLWTDPATQLQVRCVAVVYRDFPTVEWTLFFKNAGSTKTPILEDIRPLDMTLQRGAGTEFVLHHAVGSPADGSDYGPRQTRLGSRSSKRLSAAGGRPSSKDLPFFNLAWADRGLIVGIGWPGQWVADLTRDSSQSIRLRAGQQRTHFTLRPGEEVRTPLIVLQFWQSGDWIRAQNLWRRWMLAHNVPRPGGRLPRPMFLASSSRAYQEMIGANEANQIMHIDRYLEEGLKIDYWWMDAGWYIQQKGWPQVGTWQIDPKRFPRGFKPISDHAHARNVKILVWFEPERVAAGTWLAENHPDWVLGGKAGGLLNLGLPVVRKWLPEHIDRLIREQGIDLYRQDFNIEPLSYWQRNDIPDRQGITEIRHVEGYLAYLDELRKRHPDMLMDCCASGGRRNDLETLRRAVPLWRSDYAFEPVGHQCMTYGISLWIPYHGTGTVACADASYYGGGWTPVEPYAFWSNAAPSLVSGIDVRVKDLDYDALRRLLAQWRQISPLYFGDYYPLTSYSRQNDVWMGWQFHRPDREDGMVQVFRRADSPYEVARLKLRGLVAEVQYRFERLDSGESFERSGRELMEKGLRVQIALSPGVATYTYRRISGPTGHENPKPQSQD